MEQFQKSYFAKLFFSCFLLFLVSSSWSQKFTVDDLISLYENDNNFFDTFVLEKGYNFYSAENNMIWYVYKNNEWNFNSVNIIYRKDQSDTLKKERCISWTFTSDSSYLSFKKELSNKHYEMYHEYTNKDDYSSTHTFMYENEKYKLQVVPQKLSIYKNVVYNVLIMKR